MKGSKRKIPRYIFFRIYLISALIYFMLLLPFLITQFLQNIEKFEGTEQIFETQIEASPSIKNDLAFSSKPNNDSALPHEHTDPLNLQTYAFLLALLLGLVFNYPFKRYFRIKSKQAHVPSSLLQFCRKYILLTPTLNAGSVFVLLTLAHVWLFYDVEQNTTLNTFEKHFYSRFLWVSMVASMLTSTLIYLWQKHQVHLRYLEHLFTAEELRIGIFKRRRGSIGRRLWIAGGMATLLPLLVVLIYLFQSITYLRDTPINLHALSEDQKVLLFGNKWMMQDLLISDTLTSTLFYINAVNARFMFVGIYSGVFVALIYIFLFVKWTTEDITRPVNELLKKMELTGRDAQAHYALVKTHDEIGALTEGYNDMSLKINNFISNIQRLNESYFRFVPRQFLDLLGKKDITEVSLGDQVMREMSVMFTDIRDFTSLSEKMTIQENFNFVNNYLGLMEPIIRRHNGFIDKYMGDAIMALFDGPVHNALDAAVEMSLTLEEYNQVRESEGEPPVRMGIGIHTGMLMLGIVGGYGKMEGTVISDAVNLASRLEGLNKLYGARLIISEATFAQITEPQRYLPRRLDRVRVKGKTTAVNIYELIAAEPEPFRSLKMKYRAQFEIAVDLYRQKDFESALKLFEEMFNQNPDDIALKLYASRCRERIIVGDISEWDGSENLTEK